MAEQAKKKPHLLPFIVSGIIIIALAAALTYFFFQYQNVQSLLHGKTQDDTAQLITTVGKLYQLPSNETPQVANVSDKTKLAKDEFFKNAENGDRVIIYQENKLAILYRPSTGKIVAVGPVAIQTPDSTTSTGSISAQVKVILWNGTDTVGLTKSAEKKVTSLNSIQVTVADKDNAKKKYTQTIVVDLTGKNQQAASQLALVVKGKVTSFPTGETKPTNTDLVIILGEDYEE